MFLKEIVQPQQLCPVLFAHLLYNADILRNQRHNLALKCLSGCICRNIKRCNQHNWTSNLPLRRIQNSIVQRFKSRGRNRIFCLSQKAVQIIDPDLNRQFIRRVVNHIFSPALVQMRHAITAYSSIDIIDISLGKLRRHNLCKRPHIPTAQRSLSRPPATIRNTIANKQHRLAILNPKIGHSILLIL